jgi:hypothetical protein
MLVLEVMDKELGLGGMWLATAGLGVVGFALARWRTWTIVPSAIAILVLAGATWSEWTDPAVGRAMRTEAGASYGWQVALAATLALTATVLGRRPPRVDSA